MTRRGEKLIASNRKAYHDFEILETYEAGLVLQGTEVKALREGRADLKESYARVEGTAAWLLGCHISPYAHGNRANHDPVRPRKLLLHRRELARLLGRVMEKGLTLVPFVYTSSTGAPRSSSGSPAAGSSWTSAAIREREERREMEREMRARARR